MAYLHDHGIVHRDLKPGNIFSDEGTVKIGDYGLAKFISCSRRSGQTESVGTVHYMAPEIANGRYGREIDTYALGIILFEMLTGRVPFEGESVGEVLMKHLTAEPDLTALAEPYRGIVQRRWRRIRTCGSRTSASWSPCCPAAASTSHSAYADRRRTAGCQLSPLLASFAVAPRSRRPTPRRWKGFKHVVNWNKPASKLADEPRRTDLEGRSARTSCGDHLHKPQSRCQKALPSLRCRGRVRDFLHR